MLYEVITIGKTVPAQITDADFHEPAVPEPHGRGRLPGGCDRHPVQPGSGIRRVRQVGRKKKMITEQTLAKIKALESDYPDRRSLVMGALWAVQREFV